MCVTMTCASLLSLWLSNWIQITIVYHNVAIQVVYACWKTTHSVLVSNTAFLLHFRKKDCFTHVAQWLGLAWLSQDPGDTLLYHQNKTEMSKMEGIANALTDALYRCIPWTSLTISNISCCCVIINKRGSSYTIQIFSVYWSSVVV